MNWKGFLRVVVIYGIFIALVFLYRHIDLLNKHLVVAEPEVVATFPAEESPVFFSGCLTLGEVFLGDVFDIESEETEGMSIVLDGKTWSLPKKGNH